MSAPLWLQLVVNGLALGCVYALLTAGLSLIFGVMRVVNFAHGALYMLGAYAAFFLVPHLGYWGGAAGAFLLLAGAGLAMHDGLLSRLPDGPEYFSRSILVTIGLLLVIQNGAIAIWSAAPRTVQTPYDLTSVHVGGLSLPLLRVLAIGISVAVVGALLVGLRVLPIGKAIRAVSQNREAALMVGFQPRRISRIAVMVGVGLAGLAGAVLAPIYTVTPLMGVSVIFKAFAIVVIGGLGSIGGTAVVAVAIGVAESLIGGYGSTVMQNSMAFVLMMAVLFVRPRGIFGQEMRV